MEDGAPEPPGVSLTAVGPYHLQVLGLVQHVCRNAHRSSTLSKDSNLGWVAPKRRNVVLHPFQREPLVIQAKVGGVVGDCIGALGETKHAEAVVGGCEDERLALREDQQRGRDGEYTHNLNAKGRQVGEGEARSGAIDKASTVAGRLALACSTKLTSTP